MHDARLPIELVSGVPVVAASENIDITNAAELRSALLEAANGSGTLVADMSRTRFCDSAGLNTLVAAHKRAQAEGGELLLVIGSAAVLRILELTGVAQVIPSFTTLDDALAHTSPNGSNGHRRPDDGLKGSARKTPAQRADADIRDTESLPCPQTGEPGWWQPRSVRKKSACERPMRQHDRRRWT